MGNVLNQNIEQISREKGIDPSVIHEALENAMVAAANKFFKGEEDLQARYDTETGTIDVFAIKKIVKRIRFFWCVSHPVLDVFIFVFCDFIQDISAKGFFITLL